GPFRARGESGPAGQHEPGLPALGQVACQGEADATETAGHEVDAARLERQPTVRGLDPRRLGRADPPVAAAVSDDGVRLDPRALPDDETRLRADPGAPPPSRRRQRPPGHAPTPLPARP